MTASPTDRQPDAQATLAEPQSLELPAEAAQAMSGVNGHYKAGRWTEALLAYEAALRIVPQLEVASLQRARCLVLLGEHMASREAFAQLLKAFPANYSGWLEVGHLCRQQGVSAQALSSYRQATALQPSRFEARVSLARLLEDAGQMEAGAAEYHRALAAAGAEKNRQVHWRMAKFRLERGDAPRAL